MALWGSHPTIARLQSARLVAGLALLFYLAFTFVALARHGGDPLWFIWVGARFQQQDSDGNRGYDGQFIYYLAAQGLAATPNLDNAPYRLQRIFLPALAGLLAWGTDTLVPWALLLVNLVAIWLSALALARWLGRQGLSPWYALMYALYIGSFMAYSRALTEPLALCLTILGLICWLERRPFWSVFFLALALLTKETMLLFVAGIGLSELLRRAIWPAIVAGLSLLPILLWELFLYARYGVIPLIAGPSLERLPLGGIIPHLTLEPGRISALLLVALPALLLLLPAWRSLQKEHGRSPAGWWMLLHCLFALLLPLDVYDHIMHAGRNAAGMVVAVLLALPAFPRVARLFLLGYWTLPTFIWLLPVLRWAPWAQLG